MTELPSLTNSEFLQAIEWDRSASPELRRAANAGEIAAFCKAWHLNRRSNQGTSKPADAFGERAMWSQPAYPEEAGLARIIARAGEVTGRKGGAVSRRPVNKPAISWQQRLVPVATDLIAAGSAEEVRPLALLAAMELIDHSGHRLTIDQFFGVWRFVLSELLMWPTVHPADPTLPTDVALVEQGEIPFLGGLVFRDVASSANLLKSGRKVLAKGLVDRTDTDGTPHADVISRLALWLAPLIRATIASDLHDGNLWNAEQRQLLANAVDRAIPLCRPDGHGALTNGLKLNSLPVLSAAASLFGVGIDDSTGAYLKAIQRAVAGKPPKRVRGGIATMPSNQSDWARFALLRSDWSVNADSVAITHHQPLPQLDATALGRAFIHGDWTLNLKLGDAVVELANEWSCVCWQSDPDADYIELQMAGPGKMSVERLVMLSRKEHFLFVADSISGVPLLNPTSKQKASPSDLPTHNQRPNTGSQQRIEYESRLTLSDGMAAATDGPTRECRITAPRFRARVFPLGLPQERVHSTANNLTIEGNQIVLKHVGEGEGLFAPLLFVWHPQRFRFDATWRSLTVTQDGKVVGPDIGVGYRMKMGDFQLMISRSLKQTGFARACLGHHTFNETVIAKFDANGDVEPILMVE